METERSDSGLERFRRLTGRRGSLWFLGGVGFLESIALPLPPDALLIPMSVMQRHRAFFYAAWTTFFSVAGGVAGYLIGAFFMETLGMGIVRFYGLEESLASYRALYADYGLWIVLAGGFTPIPYKIITLSAGAGLMNPLTFIIASVISRGARFFLLAFLCRLFGEEVEEILTSLMGKSERLSSLILYALLATIAFSALILIIFPVLL